jgi:hypothetical protein
VGIKNLFITLSLRISHQSLLSTGTLRVINPIYRPKYFQINITDEDDTITTIGNNDKGDNMMEFYVSIYMPSATPIESVAAEAWPDDVPF